jgi:hypothetical protein
MIGYYTAAEIALLYRRPLGTIYRLAATRHWQRSQDQKRPVLYRVNDVEKTFGSLRAYRRHAEASNQS